MLNRFQSTLGLSPHRLVYERPPRRKEVKQGLAESEQVFGEANQALSDLQKTISPKSSKIESRPFTGQAEAPNVNPDEVAKNLALLQATTETTHEPEHLMDYKEYWLMRHVNALAGKYFIHMDFNEYLERTGSEDLQKTIQLLIENSLDCHFERFKDEQGEVIVITKRKTRFPNAPENKAIPNNFEIKLRVPETLEQPAIEEADFLAHAYITHINGKNILNQGAPTWELDEDAHEAERMNLETEYFNQLSRGVETLTLQNEQLVDKKTDQQIMVEAMRKIDPKLLDHHLQVTADFPSRVQTLLKIWEKTGILDSENLPQGVAWLKGAKFPANAQELIALKEKLAAGQTTGESFIMVMPVPNNQGKKLYRICDVLTAADTAGGLGLVVNEFGVPMKLNDEEKWVQDLEGSYFDVHPLFNSTVLAEKLQKADANTIELLNTKLISDLGYEVLALKAKKQDMIDKKAEPNKLDRLEREIQDKEKIHNDLKRESKGASKAVLIGFILQLTDYRNVQRNIEFLDKKAAE